MALITTRHQGSVTVLTLNRPDKLNALSLELEEQLNASISSEAIRASDILVIAGEGRAFSAGADVTEMHDTTPDAILSYYRSTGDLYERVAMLPQLTIAAIHGYCLGGGFELALACDFRVAEVGSTFGFPEVGLGILPSSGGTMRLVRAVGPVVARELLLLPDRFDVDRARGLGLVTMVAPEGQGLTRAMELADELAQLPKMAVQITKRVIDVLPEASREAGLLIERLGYIAMSQTADHKQETGEFISSHNESPE